MPGLKKAGTTGEGARRRPKVDGKIGIKTFLQIVTDFESTCLGDKAMPAPAKLAVSPVTKRPYRSRPSRARR